MARKGKQRRRSNKVRARKAPTKKKAAKALSKSKKTQTSRERNRVMAKSGKPNILVIWGDDIGISNLSCYSHGLMGYKTPNIDRIAKEGMMFTDAYGEQSCTAGRSSFITGQSVLRTGLSKVGMPGAPVGMTDKAVTSR